MRFELRLATRHLTASGGQTAVIISGVAVAVTLVVFVTSLIYGVQGRLIRNTTGSIPLVTVGVPEVDARAPDTISGTGKNAMVIGETRERPFTRETLTEWRRLEGQMADFPHVVAVSSGVTGQALAVHAGREASVRVIGAEPEKEDRIVKISEDLVEGRYLGLGAREVVIGRELADTLGVKLGDRVRLVSGDGLADTFRVAGVIDSGQQTVDSQTAFVTLRAAQALFDKAGEVTSITLTLDEIFAANDVADLIQQSTGLEAKSWMRENARIVSALRAQSGSSLMISGFSLVAAGFAIASVLIVSVVRRSSEIGILKSMGARSDQILRVFTLEAFGIGVLGSVLGALLGTGLLIALSRIPQPSRIPGRPPEPLFPIAIDPKVIGYTALAVIVVAVLASVLPARRAASLDPVEVLRRG